MPSFLIFGCANFYGRALIKLLCDERDKAQNSDEEWIIRGVDKVLPALAKFPSEVLQLYDTFDYRMGNLRSKEFLERAFDHDSLSTWDYVFNFASEFKFGQSKQVYEQDIYQLSVNVASLAKQFDAGVLVHLSTAHVFKPDNGANSRCKEDHELEAPNALSECFIKAETDIQKIPDLPLVILRPSLCYGPGDRQNIVPLLIMAQISKVQGEKMQVLWEKDLPVNTVHVDDVANAAIKAAKWHKSKATTAVFNLSDPGDTTNSKLAKCVGRLFDVEVSFQNSAVNFLVKKLKTSELTEEVNESFLGPWMDLLAKHGIDNSPLSPYLDQEHPYCRLDQFPLGVDGSGIANVSEIGFDYSHKEITPESLSVTIDEFKLLNLWPSISN
ncbi:hypothetical protein GGI12_002500 [Dipsacomyces acuminosporus]|nr:hypothetical protein GGI12_002500 [Dipsacomyces acuminosporus]